MSPYYLGIDHGGTVTKAALYDQGGREIALCSQQAQILAPQPGFVERDLRELWNSTQTCLRGVIAQSGIRAQQIAAVATSCHGKGLYLLGADGKPAYNGILSSDTRALDTARQLQQVAHSLYPISLQQLWACHPAVLLKWFADHQPQVLEATQHILMGHDYLRYCLTGQFGAEITNMSGSGLVDVRQGQYSAEILRILGLEGLASKLPPLVGSSEQCGRLSPQAATQTGIPAGTPVYAGFFDVVAAAISAGLVNRREINATMGTWCIATCLADEILPTEYPYVWGNYCLDGVYFAHEGSPTSASNLDWFLQHFLSTGSTKNNPPTNIWRHCNHLVATAQKENAANKRNGAERLLFLPFLYACNITPADLGAAFLGLQSHHCQGDLLLAIYEGILFAHKMHLERLYHIVPQHNLAQITLVGGPTRSDLWMQLCADIMGHRVAIPEGQQAGCKGAALAAMVGSGAYTNFAEAATATLHWHQVFEPDLRRLEFYQDKYQRYCHISQVLAECEG